MIHFAIYRPFKSCVDLDRSTKKKDLNGALKCRAVAIAIDLKDKSGTKLKDFRAYLEEKGIPSEITELKDEVEAYASRFPTIGFEKSTMRYKE